MPYSHHSHSGQFCPGHAHDALEQVIQTAISKQMQVFALTEHMPRHDIDQYPEEKDSGSNLDLLIANEAAYFGEAIRLRDKYKSQIELPIGFECEWIRPESLGLIQRSLRSHSYDFFVGSVHHVHTIPIDYDHESYLLAKQKAGGTDQRLFEDYFDAQLGMLQALQPPVVGHFDLIRLKSDSPDGTLQHMPGVWQRVERNLDFVASYGGILELNFASLRKGMSEPYPKQEICQVAVAKQVRFCLSDDSHGMDQVALNYHRALPFLRNSGIKSLCYLKHNAQAQSLHDPRFPNLELAQASLSELESHRFWSAVVEEHPRSGT